MRHLVPLLVLSVFPWLPASASASPRVDASRCPDDRRAIVDRPSLSADIVELVNEHRARRGLVQLQVDDALVRAAVMHARWMSRANRFTHTGASGSSPAQRRSWCGHAVGAGAGTWAGAENIAGGQRTAEAVVDSWLDSPPHRANIENAAFRYIGVASIVGSGEWRRYHVQVFHTHPDASPTEIPDPVTADRNTNIIEDPLRTTWVMPAGPANGHWTRPVVTYGRHTGVRGVFRRDAAGRIGFAPARDAFGRARLIVSAWSLTGERAEEPSRMSWRVVPRPDAPRPAADHRSTRRAAPRTLDVDVLANDRDPDGDALRLLAISMPPAVGEASMLDDDTIRLRRPATPDGAMRLRYVVADSTGRRGTAIVTWSW